VEIASLETTTLSALGREAVGYLLQNDYPSLANRFGYALAYGRDPAKAIQEDLARLLLDLGAGAVASEQNCAEPSLSFFAPNSARLLAFVECTLLADNGAALLIELVATGSAAKMHFTLEDISNARPNKSLERTREK
jgi:hypothetical protein